MSIINHIRKENHGEPHTKVTIVYPLVEVEGEVRTVRMEGHVGEIDDYLPSNLDKKGISVSDVNPESFRSVDSMDTFDNIEAVSKKVEAARAARKAENHKENE